MSSLPTSTCGVAGPLRVPALCALVRVGARWRRAKRREHLGVVVSRPGASATAALGRRPELLEVVRRVVQLRGVSAWVRSVLQRSADTLRFDRPPSRRRIGPRSCRVEVAPRRRMPKWCLGERRIHRGVTAVRWTCSQGAMSDPQSAASATTVSHTTKRLTEFLGRAVVRLCRDVKRPPAVNPGAFSQIATLRCRGWWVTPQCKRGVLSVTSNSSPG